MLLDLDRAHAIARTYQAGTGQLSRDQSLHLLAQSFGYDGWPRMASDLASSARTACVIPATACNAAGGEEAAFEAQRTFAKLNEAALVELFLELISAGFDTDDPFVFDDLLADAENYPDQDSVRLVVNARIANGDVSRLRVDQNTAQAWLLAFRPEVYDTLEDRVDDETSEGLRQFADSFRRHGAAVTTDASTHAALEAIHGHMLGRTHQD